MQFFYSCLIIIKKSNIFGQNMILTFNWQIFDFPIPSNQSFSKYLPIPKPSQSQLSQNSPTIQIVNTQTTSLKSPSFSFLFSYQIEQPLTNQPEIHLFPEIILFDSKIQLSLVEERKQKNYIYQYLKIQNCQCYQNLITFLMRIKFINQEGGSKINNIEKLINLIGSRKLNSHSFQTYSVVKKQLSIEQPFISEVKYNPKGYITIKTTRLQDTSCGIFIHSVEIMTWLCENDQIKYFECENVLDYLRGDDKKFIQLNPKESYVWMFKMVENLNTKNVMKYQEKNVYEVPYSIVYSVKGKQEKFKIIKIIKIQ